MDKVLAFSILSASPADIAAGAGAGAGLGGRWPRLSWRWGAVDNQAAEPAQARRQQQRGSRSHDGSKQRARGETAAFLPRFAPEFDGIDCFETIVSH